MKYNFNEFAIEVNRFVKAVGFDNSDVPLRIALIHSEISEAFEAFRKDNLCDANLHTRVDAENDAEFKLRFEASIKDTFEDELADTIIRLFDLCGSRGIDIDKHIELKMRYNAMRGYKYGGKKF